ncbi:glycosyltransferase [Paenibacillus doosanensis]|nr:glycosyltransferase [Paenibacillus doosanensis]
MIVKDEEACVERCLQSVRGIADEMIIVDTGSTDKTPSICKSFGAEVFDFPWEDSFAKARNYGLKKASGDWILWLDADEELRAGHASELRDVVASTPHDVLLMTLVNFYGKTADLDQVYTSASHRLFRNGLGIQFTNDIHEQLNLPELSASLSGIGILPVSIYHYGYLDTVTESKNKFERNFTMLVKEKQKSGHSPLVSYHIASEYYRIKEYKQAFDELNHAILGFLNIGQLPPSIVYKMKYDILLALGSIDGAWPAIEKAIALYPDYVDLHFYKGIILYVKGRIEEALAAFQKCLELGDGPLHYLSLKGVGSFQALYYMGLCHEKNGDLNEAKRFYEQTLQVCSNHAAAQQKVGWDPIRLT